MPFGWQQDLIYHHCLTIIHYQSLSLLFAISIYMIYMQLSSAVRLVCQPTDQSSNNHQGSAHYSTQL